MLVAPAAKRLPICFDTLGGSTNDEYHERDMRLSFGFTVSYKKEKMSFK